MNIRIYNCLRKVAFLQNQNHLDTIGTSVAGGDPLAQSATVDPKENQGRQNLLKNLRPPDAPTNIDYIMEFGPVKAWELNNWVESAPKISKGRSLPDDKKAFRDWLYKMPEDLGEGFDALDHKYTKPDYTKDAWKNYRNLKRMYALSQLDLKTQVPVINALYDIQALNSMNGDSSKNLTLSDMQKFKDSINFIFGTTQYKPGTREVFLNFLDDDQRKQLFSRRNLLHTSANLPEELIGVFNNAMTQPNYTPSSSDISAILNNWEELDKALDVFGQHTSDLKLDAETANKLSTLSQLVSPQTKGLLDAAINSGLVDIEALKRDPQKALAALQTKLQDKNVLLDPKIKPVLDNAIPWLTTKDNISALTQLDPKLGASAQGAIKDLAFLQNNQDELRYMSKLAKIR